MNNYLEAYQAEMTAQTPVHVGSGLKLNKKEYVFQRSSGKVHVMDIQKMFSGLARKGLQRQFTDYYLEQRSSDLNRWFSDNRVGPSDYNSWISYTLEGGGCLAEKGRRAEIIPFQKDAYGCPYIPGTTIKGMLRTILLSYELANDSSLCGTLRNELARKARNSRDKRQYFLKEEHREIEKEVFHILAREDEKGKPVPANNAVNDCLSGLIVSDSEPLSTSDLVLCQKLDFAPDGGENKLPILRESLKPGTVIRFRITIDAAVCKYSIEDIQEAVKLFGELYFDMFLRHFKNTDRPGPDNVWVGGGTGFAAKTVVYPLLGYKAGVMTTMEIFNKTLSNDARIHHKHEYDNRLGVSPHMLKCTEYHGKRCQMGICRLSFSRINN